MKKSELIKQLKALKESTKGIDRQAQMDRYVYDRMQSIAGIINETAYVEEDSETDTLIGKRFHQQEQGYTTSGRGTITTWWKVLRKIEPGEKEYSDKSPKYECEVVNEEEKRSRGAFSKKVFTKEYIEQNLETSIYGKK